MAAGADTSKPTKTYYDRASHPDLLTLRHVCLSEKFVFDTILPTNIESIEFHSYFDKPIPDGYLPKSLKILNLGWYFRQELTNENIPESVETISLGFWYNKKPKLNRRNLKLFDVRDSYKIIVDDDLLPVMPPYYITNYEAISKLTPEYYQKCLIFDGYLPEFESKEDFEEKTKEEIDKWIREFSEKYCFSPDDPEIIFPDLIPIEMQNDYFHRFNINFSEYSELKAWEEKYELPLTPEKDFVDCGDLLQISTLEFTTNEKNQLIVSIRFEGTWRFYRTVFIGHNDKYYKVYMYESSPYTCRTYSHVLDEKIGPLTIVETTKFTYDNSY